MCSTWGNWSGWGEEALFIPMTVTGKTGRPHLALCTMFEPINLVLQWPSRFAEVDACAKRLQATFGVLRETSSTLASWGVVSDSLDEHLTAQTITVENTEKLTEALLEGRSRKDFPPTEVIDDLGFSSLFWNLKEDEKYASLSVLCGLYAKNVSCNHLELSIRQFSPPLMGPDQYIELLKKLTAVWEANLAVVFWKPRGLEGYDKSSYLAHYHVPGTDFNRYWKKTGKLVDIYLGGELRVDEKVKAMFSSGNFEEADLVGFWAKLKSRF
jgi:hypothetical protein